MPKRTEPTEAQRDQAALWLARRAGRSIGEDDKKAFADWIARDPANLRAYEEVTEVWSRLDAPAQSLAARASTNRPHARFLLGVLLPIATLTIVLVVVFLGPSWLDKPSGDVVTARGEQSILGLPDGSRVSVGPDSALALDFAGRRSVTLRRGQAYFEVRRDLTEPFTVEVDGARITVLGTKFDVNRYDQRVIITVVTGAIEVKDRLGKIIRLDHGHRAVVEEGRVGAAELADVHAATAWLSRRLVLENASLADTVATLRRRTPGRILLLGNHESKTISGTFPADDVQASLDTIAHVTGIRVLRLGSWVTILF